MALAEDVCNYLDGKPLVAEWGLRDQLAQTQKAQQAEEERAQQLKKVSDFQAGMLGSIDTKAAEWQAKLPAPAPTP